MEDTRSRVTEELARDFQVFFGIDPEEAFELCRGDLRSKEFKLFCDLPTESREPYDRCRFFSLPVHAYWHIRGGAVLEAVEAVDGALLDFGAGIGTFALAAAARGHNVTAVEPSILSRAFLAYRKERLGLELEIRTCLPMQGEAYNSIVCLNVLQHIPEWQTTLGQLLCLLGPGGRFIETTEFRSNSTEVSTRVDEGMRTLEDRLIQLGFEHTDDIAECRVWQRLH